LILIECGVITIKLLTLPDLTGMIASQLFSSIDLIKNRSNIVVKNAIRSFISNDN